MSNATPILPDAMNHLAKARDYIAIAESQDSKREAYMKAADEIIAAQKDDPTLSGREIGQRIGKGKTWVNDLVQWRTSDRAHGLPFERTEKDTHEIRQQRDAEKVLADPEQRRQVIASLPPAQVEAIIEDANEVAIERSRAHYAERKPTAGDLTGGEKWDPGESWADTLILRVDTNTRALENHVRQWGLVIGSLNEDDALAYVEQSERRLAEVRAALQERARDRAREEV